MQARRKNFESVLPILFIKSEHSENLLYFILLKDPSKCYFEKIKSTKKKKKSLTVCCWVRCLPRRLQFDKPCRTSRIRNCLLWNRLPVPLRSTPLHRDNRPPLRSSQEPGEICHLKNKNKKRKKKEKKGIY